MVRDNLDKNVIVEEYKKRFAQILEFTMAHGGNVVDEADDEQKEDNAEMPEEVEGGEEMPQDVDMNPQSEMGDMQQDGANMPMDNDGEDVAGGFNPQVDNDMEQNDMSMMHPEDEVVDITELTDAQEETQEEIEQFDEKFARAINAIKSLEDLIKKNDSKIEDLEVELKKRNPTPMEKMNNRRTISYPFNVSPEDYWKEKESEGVYSTEDDNNGKDSEEYVKIGRAHV